jgi:GNAT superfamily N-acetyltransferase
LTRISVVVLQRRGIRALDNALYRRELYKHVLLACGFPGRPGAWTGRCMTGVGLRPATLADSEFCFGLHKAAMGGYITATWGWDEQRQRGFHARGSGPGRWQIITAGETDIGMLHVEYRPGEIYLSRIEILLRHQGRGTGTRLISALIDQAGRKGQDLVLDVLTVNTRARALYQRLGMKEVARHGPGNIKITMRSPRPCREDPHAI